MTDATSAQREARLLYRAMVRAGPRVAGSTAGLVAIYYLLPLDHTTTWAAVIILVAGLVLLVGLIAVQVRLITAHRYPAVRAAEALATSIPLFLLPFASTYVFLGSLSVGNFGERLTHTDALYFAVTVFSTVGFGDITAKSEMARLVVTGQMLADLVVLGSGSGSSWVRSAVAGCSSQETTPTRHLPGRSASGRNAPGRRRPDRRCPG